MDVIPYIFKDNMTETDALKLERELISRFGRRNLNEGILSNLTDGGEGGQRVVWTDQMRERKRIQMTGPGSPTYGVGHSKEAREKMSKSQKARAAAGLQSRHSEAHKQKLREDNKGGQATRKVVLKLLPDGTLIERFPSMTAAARSIGMTKNNFSHSVVKDGSIPRDGYFYRYEDSPDILPMGVANANELIAHRDKHLRHALAGKPVIKVDPLDGSEIARYESCKEAARQNPNAKYDTLKAAIRYDRKYMGFIWKYE